VLKLHPDRKLERPCLPTQDPFVNIPRVCSNILAMALLLAPLTGHALETTEVILAGEHFQVELAVSREEKQQGLMHRDQLPDGTGMLFIYAIPQPTRFWNRNVRFPIDILYFDKNRAFLRADTRVPSCSESPCPVYQTVQRIKYVLELPAGTLERLELQPGQRITFR